MDSSNLENIADNESIDSKWYLSFWSLPVVGLSDDLREVGESCSLEYGSQEPPEISSDAAERESEVHALPEERVKSAPYSSLEIMLQGLNELRNLSRRR